MVTCAVFFLVAGLLLVAFVLLFLPHNPAEAMHGFLPGMVILFAITLLLAATFYLCLYCRHLQREWNARHDMMARNMERFQELSKQSRTFAWEIDTHGRYTYVSDSVETVTGYTPEELVGKRTYVDLAPEEMQAALKSDAESFISARMAFRDHVNCIRCRDGRHRWVSTSGMPLFDAKGEWCGYRGCDTDVTARKEARDAANKAAEDRRILLDNIQTQVWYLTDDRTYGAVNQAHADFTGLAVEDFAFKAMDHIFPPDVVETCRHSSVGVFKTGRAVQTEEWLPHASGSRRLLSIMKSPKLRPDGSVEYVVCSAEDITERRRLEQEVVNAGLREQQRIGRDLHDTLGQELTGLSLMAKSLEKRITALDPLLGEKAAELSSQAGKSARCARDIAHGLSPVGIDANGLNTELLRMGERVVERYGVQCNVDTDEIVSLNDDQAAAHLYHIVQESVTNAIKHASASRIDISIRNNHEEGTLTIVDDGKGFHQGSSGSHGGVGLRIMLYRAEIIKAKLSIRNLPEGGTCVTCLFPCLASTDAGSPLVDTPTEKLIG